MPNEIQDYCVSLARRGLRGHELLVKVEKHFNEPKVLMCMLMDSSELAKRMHKAMYECIHKDILNAVIAQNHKALS